MSTVWRNLGEGRYERLGRMDVAATMRDYTGKNHVAIALEGVLTFEGAAGSLLVDTEVCYLPGPGSGQVVSRGTNRARRRAERKKKGRS